MRTTTKEMLGKIAKNGHHSEVIFISSAHKSGLISISMYPLGRNQKHNSVLSYRHCETEEAAVCLTFPNRRGGKCKYL